MIRKRVLFVLTGHDRLGDGGDSQAAKTGFHLTETATPWCRLIDAGVDVVITTPEGGPAKIDPSSRDDGPRDNRRFVAALGVTDGLDTTAALGSLHPADFDGLYFPGGHGTMWDLPGHPVVSRFIDEMVGAEKLVAAICHGPAALVNQTNTRGSHWLSQRRITAFTDSEEIATGKATLMPFSLEQAIRRTGASFVTAEDFSSCVVVDGPLITGQNPASSAALAAAMLIALQSPD